MRFVRLCILDHLECFVYRCSRPLDKTLLLWFREQSSPLWKWCILRYSQRLFCLNMFSLHVINQPGALYFSFPSLIPLSFFVACHIHVITSVFPFVSQFIPCDVHLATVARPTFTTLFSPWYLWLLFKPYSFAPFSLRPYPLSFWFSTNLCLIYCIRHQWSNSVFAHILSRKL